MNREIKFRYIFENITENGRFFVTQIWNLNDVERNDIIYATCALIARDQYTGLKDKNGVEIYESDIVKGNYLRLAGVIKWNDKFCKFNISDRMNISPSDVFEVIGNIYENPELITN